MMIKMNSYPEIEAEAQKCRKCPLSKTRKTVVFGSGPVPCDLMLIGEAPGADEDEQGLPFVGKAGQLLTKILESINIRRPDDIYITNTVKCRPPENRLPTEEETEACHPYLEAQIETIKPKIILLAGSAATRLILKTDRPIGKLRGQWFKLPKTEIKVMPIFHPSYLLRNQSTAEGSPKWLMWKDMKELKAQIAKLKTKT